jgi:hypothetical protein
MCTVCALEVTAFPLFLLQLSQALCYVGSGCTRVRFMVLFVAFYLVFCKVVLDKFASIGAAAQ